MTSDIAKLLSICDHTLLKQIAAWDDIRRLIDDAIEFGTASVCIPSCFVGKAAEYAEGRITICTVIGFPNGYETTGAKVFQAEDAVRNGAGEVDMVLNIGMLKAGEIEYVTNEIAEIKRACGDRVLKVIIECCLLTDEEKILACKAVTDGGADFIKTSTGFSTGGATVEDVKLLAEHIGSKPDGSRIEVKAAGGIGSFDDAAAMVAAGATRLGTSRLVKLAKEQA
jgi:deoxyribose-phosphate aldolase